MYNFEVYGEGFGSGVMYLGWLGFVCRIWAENNGDNGCTMMVGDVYWE